jgi:hypothetical protein
MATEKDLIIDGTHEAGADLSTHQHKFVKLDANNRVILCTALTDVPFGILQNKPDALGKGADVARFGTQVKVSADAALSVGDQVGPSADGQADARVIGTDTTHYVVGIVTGAVSNAGELATISLNCINPHRAA